jgi:hypothetical protein
VFRDDGSELQDTSAGSGALLTNADEFEARIVAWPAAIATYPSRCKYQTASSNVLDIQAAERVDFLAGRGAVES